ncbi:MAG: polysaccharide biosynthesis tyrosine autokinase [Flavobacteriales bacterium]|nr:polysaccharide biosynthesis tyrosine autokinase [Flavobacteriales bacterium]
MDSKPNNGTDKVDIPILLYLRSYWYIFVISLLGTLGAAFLYLKLVTPVYKVSSTILLEEEHREAHGLNNYFKGMDLLPNDVNLENEIGKLKSYDLVSKALGELQFRVNYFKEGPFNKSELYKKSLFWVSIDTKGPQIINAPIYVVKNDDSSFSVSLEMEEYSVYFPGKSYSIKNFNQPFKLEKTLKENEEFRSDYLTFKIYNNPYYDTLFSGNIQDDERLYFIIRAENGIVQNYQKKLEIKQTNKDASILELSIAAPAPEKQIDFLNQIIKTYQEDELTQKNEYTVNTIKFIEEQLNNISDSLNQTEDALADYQSENQVVDLNFSASRIFEEIQKLNVEVAQSELVKKYYNSLLEHLKTSNDYQSIISPSSLDINSPELTQQIKELQGLDIKISGMAQIVTDKNLELNVLKSQRDTLKQNLLASVNNLIHVQELTIQEKTARQSSLDKELKKLPQSEKVLTDFQRKYNLNAGLYEYLLNQKAWTGIVMAANSSSCKVLDEPQIIGVSPISPKRNLVFILAILMGLAIPFVGLLLLMLNNKSIMTVEQIKGIHEDLETVVAIPQTNKKSVLEAHAVHSPLGEAFRTLRVQCFRNNEKKPLIIGVSSDSAGVGKTFSSTRLAFVTAKTEKKTLLLEADLRRPTIRMHYPNLKDNRGLSAWLEEKASFEDVVQSSGIEHLDVVTSGETELSPLELFTERNVKRILEDVKSKYDVIILDTPPFDMVEDFAMLSPFVDLGLFIFKFKKSTNDSVQKSLKFVKKYNVDKIVAVLNGVSSAGHPYYGYYSKKGGSRFNPFRLFRRT